MARQQGWFALVLALAIAAAGRNPLSAAGDSDGYACRRETRPAPSVSERQGRRAARSGAVVEQLEELLRLAAGARAHVEHMHARPDVQKQWRHLRGGGGRGRGEASPSCQPRGVLGRVKGCTIGRIKRCTIGRGVGREGWRAFLPSTRPPAGGHCRAPARVTASCGTP